MSNSELRSNIVSYSYWLTLLYFSPHLHQLLKQSHPIFFHLSGIEEFLVMLEPVAVLETFFGVVAGRIAVIGFYESLYFLVFL